jgi:periplasmic protein TonB
VRTMLSVAALSMALAGTALAQSGDIYPIGNGVTSPRLLKEVKPTYTEGALKRRVQGLVEMECVVLTDGSVDDSVKITRSLDDELDQQAIKALRQWTFSPGTRDGKAVAVRVNVEMTFMLRDKK